MSDTPVTLADDSGRITFEGTLSGDLQGLPTGWTENTNDPADVDTNGGLLTGRIEATELEVAGALNATDTPNLGFYGTPPVAQPTVTNATAADILAALVTLGLVIDGT